MRTAHKLAMACDWITSEMVEISEFPHLAVKYDVQGVPKTVINEKHHLMGAQPPSKLVDAILSAVTEK